MDAADELGTYKTVRTRFRSPHSKNLKDLQDLTFQEDVEWDSVIWTRRFICTRNRHKITQAA